MAKENTRKKILKAAEKLFSQNGYDGVPTKLIAKEAGITEMTLFNHFFNKELLYKSVVNERYLAIEIESVFSQLTYDNLEKDLMSVTLKLIENFVNNKKILKMRLMEKQSFQKDANFRMETDPLLKQITPLFESYGEKGIIENPIDRTAMLFMATFKGMCHISLLENKSEKKIKDITYEFVNIFCHGIMEKEKKEPVNG